MEEHLEEILSFIEGDAKWWDQAAKHCEDLAGKLVAQEQSEWQLLAAVYHERAETHRQLGQKIRQWWAG